MCVCPSKLPGSRRGAALTYLPLQDAPSRRRAPWDVPPPWAEVSGSQTDLLTPWHDGRAEIPPFHYMPQLLGGKGISHVGWDAGDLPNLEKYATTLNKHKNPSCRSAVTES